MSATTRQIASASQRRLPAQPIATADRGTDPGEKPAPAAGVSLEPGQGADIKPAAKPQATLIASPAGLTADDGAAADHYSYASIDHAFKANLARLTFGLSPAVLAEQWFDWLVHLAVLPGKQLQLAENWFRKTARFGLYAAESMVNPATPPCIASSKVKNSRNDAGTLAARSSRKNEMNITYVSALKAAGRPQRSNIPVGCAIPVERRGACRSGRSQDGSARHRAPILATGRPSNLPPAPRLLACARRLQRRWK